MSKVFKCFASTTIFIFLSFHIKSEFFRPWVFWYWIDAAVSREGIKADLESMSKAGIEGAYLMFIKGEKQPPLYQPAAIQLSDYWWDCLKFAFSEAKKLNIKLALHISDGFAVAGGPWITPELSMQKLVFSELFVKGPTNYFNKLPQPEINENFYKDIAVYAIPIDSTYLLTSFSIKPIVITSIGDDASFLVEKGNKQVFKSNNPCWIQYNFEKPFTCRSITIFNNNTNYQSLRMTFQISDDGVNFRDYYKMIPPRHGWQDEGIRSTFSIPEVTSKYFRFVFNPEGSEPGAEDLDFAKWKPVLRVTGIELSGMPRINQFEGKSGKVWRIGEITSKNQIPENLCIPESKIINITDKFDGNLLHWSIPEGNWLILRIGHTSTGKTNATGGGAKGLECDKFNPYSIRIQLDSWFGRIYDTLLKYNLIEPLKILHIDSWECGSQNWSENFPFEFINRRGYDLIPVLPVIAGIPINNVDFSEKILFDLRKTISELIRDVFFYEVKNYANQHNCLLSAESVSPVMVVDNLSYYKNVDIPMGEFWLDSPTHDKPTDVLDAINASNIFGKKIVGAESFTQLRINWREHPAILKPIADFYMTQGINWFVFHLFAHNPWINRIPGMTLDRIGLYFQRDQLWLSNGGKAFLNYLSNCTNLLQQGIPIADIAIFTGNEIPSRSILPHQLYEIVPEIFKNSIKKFEFYRNYNVLNIVEKPDGVLHTSAIPSLTNYVDPFNGYKYFSVNADAILASYVKNNKIFIGDTEYSILIFPGSRKMDPRGNIYEKNLIDKIFELIYNGAIIYFAEKPENLSKEHDTLFNHKIIKYGKGVLLYKHIDANFLNKLVNKDFYAIEQNNLYFYDSLAWLHKRNDNNEIYFISNQSNSSKKLRCYFRVVNKNVVIYDPLQNIYYVPKSKIIDKYTYINLDFEGFQSFFVLFSNDELKNCIELSQNKVISEITLKTLWNVRFFNKIENEEFEIQIDSLKSWTEFNDDKIKYFSGTALYSGKIKISKINKNNRVYLDLGKVYNIAEIYVNRKYVSTLWIMPYKVDVTNYLIKGENYIEIYVTNTWFNRFKKELNLQSQNPNIKFFTSFDIKGDLENSGLIGPVKLLFKIK